MESFVNELAEEVQKRLQALGLKGKCITLKMKVRKAGAPTPRKFMGHGICDNIARSCTLPTVTDEAQVIAKQCHALLKQLSVPPEDMRGMGIQVSKLNDKKAGTSDKNTRSLFDFMKPQSIDTEVVTKSAASERAAEIKGENYIRSPAESPVQEKGETTLTLPPLPKFSPQITQQASNSRSEKRLGDLGESLYLPSPSQIDPTVLEALPEDIRRSIEKSYAARNKRIPPPKTGRQEEDETSPKQIPQKKGIKNKKGKAASKSSRLLFEDNNLSEGVVLRASDLLPSPSQIDPEFLAALPEDVRQEIEQACKRKNLLRAPSNVQEGYLGDRISNLAPGNETKRISTARVKAEDVSNTEKSQIIAPPKQARLGEAATLCDVKKVITDWTSSYEVPLEEDVEVFRDYLLQLIGLKNLEQLWRVLKFLDRRIEGREDWKNVSCAVLAQVQHHLQQNYSSKLSVKSLKFCSS